MPISRMPPIRSTALPRPAPAKFRERGLVQIDIDPVQRAEFEKIGGKPVWDAWAEKMTGVGYDGPALLQLILDLAEKHKDAAN